MRFMGLRAHAVGTDNWTWHVAALENQSWAAARMQVYRL
jgi:hypothetical protein